MVDEPADLRVAKMSDSLRRKYCTPNLNRRARSESPYTKCSTLQGRKLLGCSRSQELGQRANLAPDLFHDSEEPIRSHVSSLTQILTLTKTKKSFRPRRRTLSRSSASGPPPAASTRTARTFRPRRADESPTRRSGNAVGKNVRHRRDGWRPPIGRLTRSPSREDRPPGMEIYEV